MKIARASIRQLTQRSGFAHPIASTNGATRSYVPSADFGSKQARKKSWSSAVIRKLLLQFEHTAPASNQAGARFQE